jgi:hypothetical protein
MTSISISLLLLYYTSPVLLRYYYIIEGILLSWVKALKLAFLQNIMQLEYELELKLDPW